jgi:DNA-binding LytR/AlgR family response regulator
VAQAAHGLGDDAEAGLVAVGAALAVAAAAQQLVQVHRSTIVKAAHLTRTRRDGASRLRLRLRGHAAELPVSLTCVHPFMAI